MGQKAEKGAVFGSENGGMSIFELLWGVFFGQNSEKIGKIRNYSEKSGKIRKKLAVLGVIWGWITTLFLWFFNIHNIVERIIHFLLTGYFSQEF